jgi:hypothetical protein
MQHLDEGTIHAWLDGQLPRDEALEVEAHVAECRQCADAVAEARGLIAASSRILTALDGVPREVVPTRRSFPAEVEAAAADAVADAFVPLEAAVGRAHRRWFNGASLAAAAAIVVAIGTVTVMKRSAKDMASLASERASPASTTSGPMSDSARSVVAAPAPPAAPAAAPSATKSLGDARGVAAERQVAGAPSNARDERKASNEVAFRAASDSTSTGARVAAVKEGESRALNSAQAGSSAIAIRGRALQRADTAANKPVDQLAKDAKQEVQAARPAQAAQQQLQAPRREPYGATIARPDTAGTDRSQQVAADAAAKTVVAGVVTGRVTDANNTGIANADGPVRSASIQPKRSAFGVNRSTCTPS